MQPCSSSLTRRGFLVGAGVGLAAGGAAGWLGLRELSRRHGFTGRTVEVARPEFGIPGAFPGRVVEVHHPGSVGDDNRVNADAVRSMMSRGMRELTGADHEQAAWRRFFEPGDVVGIKVNPVGFSDRKKGLASSISSPEVLVEVVEGLRSAGVRKRDIIVFERYATEFRNAGYDKIADDLGVHWYTASSTTDSLDIEGYDTEAARRDRDPHVVGYDPDVFVSMGYANRHHDSDGRRFRSHLTVIVSRLVNKFITIPCLKDHRSAGVTLALKNLSHGLNNNVSRSHISNVYLHNQGAPEAISNPNQCNTFIPTAVAQGPIRKKATLHILDGLIGVYEGGPGSWNQTWATWRARSLFFATDPVAMDHVGWDIIDAKRAREGWRPVAQMGTLFPPEQSTSTRPQLEQFNTRQPEHIILAGTIGLGTFDAQGIEHRRVSLHDSV